MSELDADEIRHALQTARQNGFGYVRLRQGETSFSARLGEPSHQEAHSVVTSAVVEDLSGPAPAEDGAVCSTAVGYVRLNTAVGHAVEAGDVIAEVVALGIANEIVAETSGSVTVLLVSDGDPVEYGQPIAKVGAK